MSQPQIAVVNTRADAPSRGRALASAGFAANYPGSLVQQAYQDKIKSAVVKRKARTCSSDTDTCLTACTMWDPCGTIWEDTHLQLRHRCLLAQQLLGPDMQGLVHLGSTDPAQGGSMGESTPRQPAGQGVTQALELIQVAVAAQDC